MDLDFAFYAENEASPCLCRRGEKFEKSRHVQGTEVKAITYSAMQVIETSDKTDIYVIIDI